jgi:hypothetical protein
MKILKSVSIVVFITLFAIGCGSSVSGTVLDDNGNPIEGAAVTIMSCSVTVTTDANGFFSATVEIGTHTLEIEMDSILIHSEQIIIEGNAPLQLSNITTNYDPDTIDNDGDSYTENQGDCNDSDININPGAEEICGDGIDQDCNSSDLTCPIPTEDIDDDGDSYTENQGDCNDSDININPGAEEICGDGIDQDCNSSDLTCPISAEDIDDDGDSYTENQGDCNDSDININPGAEEICGDGIDQDCNLSDLTCPNPADDIDDDGDTFTENQGDCDDGDAAVYPGALKICDGKDSNCDGKRDFSTDKDEDGDGVPMCGGDCNDSDSSINPDAEEICGDGIDQDCNSSDLTCPI